MVFYPKISIVIPVYNGGDYLCEAIDSALAQTYQNIEILLVNDGSNDDGNTERVALSYGDKIRYFSKPNGGVASALNRAIAEMSGEYFSWLSHDDLYCKEKIEKQVEALNRLGYDGVIIYSDYYVFTTNPAIVSPSRMKGVPPEQFRYWITAENTLHGCTLLIPRSAFEKCGDFNEGLRTTQDYDLWFRLAKEFRFVHIDNVLVKARCHANQGSNKMADIALAECNNLLTGFVENLTTDEILSASGKQLSEAYSDIASSMYRRGFDQAGRLADKLAKEHEVSGLGYGGRVMQKSIRRSQDYGIKFIRKILPPQVRQMIKNSFLYYGLNQNRKNEEIGAAGLKEKFSEIYDKNIFGGRVSRSGEGSDLTQTAIIRRELPRIVKEIGIKTFLDAPCGDWCWMKEVDLGVNQYIGVDIVDAMITRHNVEFGNASISFQSLNLAEAVLPKVDLIFSRDCLVHLTFEDALKIIANFKRSGAKYLLTTTFVDRNKNNDLVGEDGFWRALNMQLSPFNFPQPILLVNEGCSEEAGQYPDKSLGLWLLADINL